jgi:outer membrane biosynthesis protein TonB
MNIDLDGAGVAPQVEQSGRTEGEDEHPGAMDVDADTADVAKRGEQSGAVDVDMREGSINEHDKATNEATPESFPSEKPPPSNVSLSNEKNSSIAGEKRKNPTREAKTKKTDELPLPPPKTKLKSRSRPRPKPKPQPESKIQPQAQPVHAVERNYFEEIEFGGISRLVDIVDLTQDMVSHLPS